MEAVEQISLPLARVFNLSLKESVVSVLEQCCMAASNGQQIVGLIRRNITFRSLYTSLETIS